MRIFPAKFSMRLPAAFQDRLLPISLSQLSGVVCGVLGVWLATHWVPPALYGHYGVFLSFAPLGPWVVHAGLIRYLNRHWAQTAGKAELSGQVVKLAAHRLPWLCVATAVAALALEGWPRWAAWLLLLGTASALSAGAIAQGGLQADRLHWRDLRANLALSTTRTFFPLVLFWATGAALALPVGLFLGTLVYAAVAWLALGLRPGASAERPAVPASFAGPLFPVLALSGWALTGVTRWIAAASFSPEAAGHFTLANNVATVLPGVLASIAVQFWQPGWFAHAHDSVEHRRHLLRRVDGSVAAFSVGAVAACGALHIVGPWLVGSVIAESFAPAIAYILPAGCFAITTSIGGFYQSALLAAKQEARIARIEFVFAAGLVTSGAVAGWAGERWFQLWLLASPGWAVACYRSLARRALLKPD